MVTGHFGLDDGPFHGKAEGDDVYVGPEQSRALAKLGKALAGADSVVALTGPVGVGKTTLLRHALANLDGKKIIVHVDRMRLAPDEILELLLARFDIHRQPTGTIQRVAAFRRLLQEQLSAETRAFIVVEDAERVGTDALLELEALTSTDSGDSCDAGIVLMGSPELLKVLAVPALARLRQRVRLRQSIDPFNVRDVRGYMRHCIDAAGGVFENIFEPGAAETVYRYTGGVARLVDNVCESALEAAAEAGLATILPALIEQVAESSGLEPLAEASLPEEPAPLHEQRQVAMHASSPGPSREPAQQAEETELSDDCPTMEADVLTVETFTRPVLSIVEGNPPVETPTVPERLIPEPMAAPVPAPATTFEEVVEEKTDAVNDQVSDEAVDDVVAERAVAEAGETGEESSADETSGEAVAGLPVNAPTISAMAVPTSETATPKSLIDETESRRPEEPPAPPPDFAMADAGESQESGNPDIASDDSANIPTLSSSTRIALKPETDTWVRPVGLDGFPEQVLSEPDVSPEPEPLPEAEPSSEAEELSEAEQLSEAEELHDAEQSFAAVELEAEFQPSREAEQSLEPVEPEAGLFDDASDSTVVAASDVTPERPELDALEAAIEAANAWQTGDDALQLADEPTSVPSQDGGELPAITLDRELDTTRETERDLDQWAADLGKAQSLEDISDMLAETLFGNDEMQQVSARIVAERPAPRAATAPQRTARSAAAHKPATVGRAQAASPGKPPAAPAQKAAAGKFDMTLSQRIDMVNTLKKGQASRPVAASNVTEIVLAVAPDRPARPPADGPMPIESQIDTAITQSRKALSEADMARLAAGNGENDDNAGNSGDKSSRGLFGFFKRSSKN